MRKNVFIAGNIAVLTAIIILSLMFGSGLYCKVNDNACVKRALTLRNDCIPSTAYIEWGNETDYFTLRITVEKVGEDCLVRESIEDVTGKPGRLLEIFGEDYEDDIQESFEEGEISDDISGDTAEPGDEPAVFNCGPEDYECRDRSIYHIQNCINAIITDREHKWYPIAYWTKYITVDRGASSCSLFFEIIDATDLPGDIPPSIVGMTMDCTVPLDDVPFQDLEEEWCIGPLYNYFQKL